jgi:hypothetical protein
MCGRKLEGCGGVVVVRVLSIMIVYEEGRGVKEPVGGSFRGKKGCRAVVVVIMIVRMLSSIIVRVEERRG